jgi:hypothetical protein
MKSESDREHQQTIRKQIVELLRKGELSVRNISQDVGIQEKEVYDHLAHIECSITAHDGKLIIVPYKCAVCGYVFVDRKKLTRPGRCPKCKKESYPVGTLSC